MLFLLDSGKLAVHYGKWRGLLYFAASAVFMCFAWVIPSIFDVIAEFSPGGSVNMPVGMYYTAIGPLVVACFLGIAGCWRLYRDEVHGDHQRDADHYKTYGW
ncbi:MAG: hypothetical protein Q8N13_22435 [Acidovorax sp.]|nr:hypothetical protein [Acidovorax sp.]